MNKELTRKKLFLIALFSLAGEIAWAVENQYYNVFLYNEISPEPIYISLMVAITTTVGTIATILMGSYSDVIGKRKPFLLYGFLLWAVTTAIFPFSAFFSFINVIFAVFIAIFFDSIMTFFGATAKNAGLNSYITDVTSLQNRSRAIGVAQMMNLIALLIVYGAAGFLIELFGYYFFFFIIGGLVAIFGVLAGYTMKDSEDLSPLEIGTFEHIRKTFKKKSLIKHKHFIYVLLVICAWQIGLNTFFPFILIYLQHYLNFSLMTASILVFIPLLISIALSYPLGTLIDKIGRKIMTTISVILLSFSLFLFGFAENFLFVLITGAFWILCYTSLSIATFSWIKDLYPEEGRGQFSGYWNLFSGTIPMIIGPLIGGWLATEFGLLKVINGQEAYVPTPIVFFAAALLILVTLIPLRYSKEKRKLKQEILEEK